MFPNIKIQTNYVEKIVKLQLYYCYYLNEKKNISLNDGLNNYCDIYRKTDLYSVHPGMDYIKNAFFPGKKKIWDKLVIQITNLLQEQRISDLNKFVEKSYKILLPRLLARIDKGYNLVEYNKSARFGCFDYDIVDKKINLHMPVFQFFGQRFSKAKIKISKPSDKYKHLLNLVEHAQKLYPNYKIIQCGIWMNTYTPFRKLFPFSWKPTGVYKKRNSLAFWGQFIDIHGNINQKHERKFIKQFNAPYSAAFYQCNILELKNHLIPKPK